MLQLMSNHIQYNITSEREACYTRIVWIYLLALSTMLIMPGYHLHYIRYLSLRHSFFSIGLPILRNESIPRCSIKSRSALTLYVCIQYIYTYELSVKVEYTIVCSNYMHTHMWVCVSMYVITCIIFHICNVSVFNRTVNIKWL